MSDMPGGPGGEGLPLSSPIESTESAHPQDPVGDKTEGPTRVVHIAPLRMPHTPLGLGKIVDRASDLMTHHATRHIRKLGIPVDQRVIDFRPEAEKDVALQTQELGEEIQGHVDQGENVIAVGSSAGGPVAHRIGYERGIRSATNQSRLAEGTPEHRPTLAEAARNHPPFGQEVRDFQANIAPQITNSTNPHQQFLTIGSEQDSVVPRDLKSLPGVPHVEVDKPKGVLGLVNKIAAKGLDHAVAIYQGLRHPALVKFIQNGD